MTRLKYRTLVSDITWDPFDQWATVMEHLFLIAEVQEVSEGITMPGYSPSRYVIMDPDSIEADYLEGKHVLDLLDAGELSTADLEQAYAVFSRYADLLDRHGWSY